jgi:hypothetical protein
MAPSSPGSQSASRSAPGSPPVSGRSDEDPPGTPRTPRQTASKARGPRPASRPKTGSSAGRSSGSGRAGDGRGNVESVKDAVTGGAQSAGDALGSAGSAVGSVAQKAKTPALAGAAAVAGLAGGFALASRGRGPRRVMGVPIPGTRKPLVQVKGPIVKLKRPGGAGVGSTSRDLMKAAGEIGNAGRQVGELVTEVQGVRAELAQSRRSTVATLLDAVLSRRGQDG